MIGKRRLQAGLWSGALRKPDGQGDLHDLCRDDAIADSPAPLQRRLSEEARDQVPAQSGQQGRRPAAIGRSAERRLDPTAC